MPSWADELGTPGIEEERIRVEVVVGKGSIRRTMPCVGTGSGVGVNLRAARCALLSVVH